VGEPKWRGRRTAHPDLFETPQLRELVIAPPQQGVQVVNRILFALIGLAAAICLSLLNIGCSSPRDSAASATHTAGLLPPSTPQASTQNSVATGTWCEAPARRVYEFNCQGTLNGSGWVPQPDGCFHRVTSTNCSCDVGADWLRRSTRSCSGTTLVIRDSCGFLKHITNHVDCGGGGGGPIPTPPPSIPGCGKMDALGCEIFHLTNAERSKAGLPTFTICDACTDMAYEHVVHMVTNNYFSHDRPGGETFVQRAARFGLSWGVGENLARGGGTAAGFVSMWMNSPGHRANILNPNFTRMGAAHYQGDAAQVFAR